MATTKDTIALSDRHNSRGIELANRGWLDEAAREFKRAIELDPASSHPHDNLATVYSAKNQLREALGEYLAAIELEPDDATAHYNLACFLASRGADLAKAQFQKSLELEPENTEARVSYAVALADSGELEQAKRELQSAIRNDPKEPLPRHQLAAVHMAEGEYQRAIPQLREVVRLSKEEGEAWLNLGICYTKQGFHAEAERAFQRADALEVDRALLNLHWAALCAISRRRPEARRRLAEALRLDRKRVMEWLDEEPDLGPLAAALDARRGSGARRAKGGAGGPGAEAEGGEQLQ